MQTPRTFLTRKSARRFRKPRHVASPSPAVESLESRVLLSTYGPLLTFSTWNQVGPIAGSTVQWNDFTPIDPATGLRSYTGCVATAIAQLAYYWHFPGNLSFSAAEAYTANPGTASAINLGTDADKDNFPTLGALNAALAAIQFNGDPTEEALLSFAMGVKAGASFSSTDTTAYLWAPTFSKLGFTSVQTGYNWDAAKSAVITNIESGEPVAISIASGSAGHALLLDGYDTSNDTFHANYGWGGLLDGWYSATALPLPGAPGPTAISEVLYNIQAPSSPPPSIPPSPPVSVDLPTPPPPAPNVVDPPVTPPPVPDVVNPPVTPPPAVDPPITPPAPPATTLTVPPTVVNPSITPPKTPAPLAPAAPTAHQLYVTQLYLDLFHRPVDSAGLTYWTAQLDQGASYHDVAHAFLTSREYDANVIDHLYLTYLGRHAESGPTGIEFWVDRMQSGLNANVIRAGILGSDEYFARAGNSNPAFVTALYHDLLHRDPGSAAMITWLDTIAASGRSRVSDGISASSENRQDTVTSYYQEYLHRAPDASGLTTWMDNLAAGVDEPTIVSFFVTSPEYLTLHQIT